MACAAFVTVTVMLVAGTVVIMAGTMFMFVMMFMFTATVVTMFFFVFVTFAGHFSVLLHVRNSGAENCADMGVIKGIIHLFSLSAAFYKSCGFKNGKLVRNGALAHFKKIAKTANAHFAFGKGGKNADPWFITENLENLRGFFKDLFGRHVGLCLFDYMGVFGVDIRQKNHLLAMKI